LQFSQGWTHARLQLTNSHPRDLIIIQKAHFKFSNKSQAKQCRRELKASNKDFSKPTSEQFGGRGLTNDEANGLYSLLPDDVDQVIQCLQQIETDEGEPLESKNWTPDLYVQWKSLSQIQNPVWELMIFIYLLIAFSFLEA
jgi:hypothetical protein